MTDNSREHNFEHEIIPVLGWDGLYLLAFGLAVAIRLLRLGEIPLGDDEARWALQALDLAKGLHTTMGPQPAYVVLTGVLFFAVQASNFAARLIPALFGAVLCLVPFYFRDRLGSKPALVLAFFLAFDPTLLGISRLAGSPIMAVSAWLLAWGTWRNANLRAAGIWAGIALLSGPALWPGVIGMLVSYGLLRGFFSAQVQKTQVVGKSKENKSTASNEIIPGRFAGQITPDTAGETLWDNPGSRTGMEAAKEDTQSRTIVNKMDADGNVSASAEQADKEQEPAAFWYVANLPSLPNAKALLLMFFYAAGTYLILGSLFLMASGGLSAGLASIPAYFGGWLSAPGVPLTRLLLGLGIYEFLAILLAAAGLLRGILKRDYLTIMLGAWLLVALVLALAYPARQLADLVWVLLPLISLAALEFSSYLVPILDGTWETIGMAVFTSALLVFALLNYFAIALTAMDSTDVQLRWWILFGSIALLLVSLAMVAFGWSFGVAIQGGLWGCLLILFIYTFATSVASAELRTSPTFEMWPTSAFIGQPETLLNQMNDLSRWKMGTKTAMDVTIAGVDSPALRWLLRDWEVTSLPDASLGAATPMIVISDSKSIQTSIAKSYRGQSLSWRVTPLWDHGLLADWLRWSILHEFPKDEEKIVLWTRSDVFIDSQNLK